MRTKYCLYLSIFILIVAASCDRADPELATPELTVEHFIMRGKHIVQGDFSDEFFWDCFTKEDEKWFGKNYEQFFKKSPAVALQKRVYYTYSSLEKAAHGLRYIVEKWVPNYDHSLQVTKNEGDVAWVQITEKVKSRYTNTITEYPGREIRVIKQGHNWKIDGFFGHRYPWKKTP